MTVVTTDLYQAAWLLMNGGTIDTSKRLSYVNRNGERKGIWEVAIIGMTAESVGQWQRGQAMGNVVELRDRRMALKKELQGYGRRKS